MLNVNSLRGLDFETYGGVDLPTHGLERYVSDPTFQPLIARIAEPIWSPSRQQWRFRNIRYDFVYDYEASRNRLIEDIEGVTLVCHNVEFERRVLKWLGIEKPASEFIDSAVISRAMGASGRLEAAAPQLLGIDKMAEGKDLIQLFSVPSKERREKGLLHFDDYVITDNLVKWGVFGDYCTLDAELGLQICIDYYDQVFMSDGDERRNNNVTVAMNERGWHVDLATVEEMQRRYKENQEQALTDFRARNGAADLNLNSLKQMKEWCQARGIKATSFNEANTAKLLARIEKKHVTMPTSDPKWQGYAEVMDLLRTKQVLGGSSLKKLKVILDTTGPDSRLRGQYLHIGAGQSWRTTGRSVQMQNLKRLAEPGDMEELQDDDVEWDNDMLAANIRQVFTATHPQGRLIVGDFKSVESRGLAWLAVEDWKLRAYAAGRDVYKAQAQQIFGIAYDQVTKDQRQTGKVGELSCGYGAGAGAVQSFAEGMSVILSEAEATKLVVDWRDANPRTVKLWALLDELLGEIMAGQHDVGAPVGKGWTVRLERIEAPATLVKQHPKVFSLRVSLRTEWNETFMVRYFHGLYMRGRNICYYKPSELKSGDLWRNSFVDPKTKERRFYSIYGGKLAGILTQSFCREIFFRCLRQVAAWGEGSPDVELIGQFHDEIVLDWRPGGATLQECERLLEHYMSDAGVVKDFPLEADVKHDYRYTK